MGLVGFDSSFYSSGFWYSMKDLRGLLRRIYSFFKLTIGNFITFWLVVYKLLWTDKGHNYVKNLLTRLNNITWSVKQKSQSWWTTLLQIWMLLQNPASRTSTEDLYNHRLKVCTRQPSIWLIVKHNHSPPVWAWVMVLNNGQEILCHSEVDLCPFGYKLSSPLHLILLDACGNYCCSYIMNCWLMTRAVIGHSHQDLSCSLSIS